MHIINTVEKLKTKSKKAKTNINKSAFYLYLTLLTFAFFGSTLFVGCIKNNELEQARNDAGRSQVSYQHAVERYKYLIKQGQDQDRLYLELGRLYSSHGDFEQAIEVFKNSREKSANKFMAISYYRLGDFNSALEIFNKQEYSNPDDEYLYYYGLTCEKLNLFDQAIELYNKIKGGPFRLKAQARINTIEKKSGQPHIKDIDGKVNNIIAGTYTQEQYPQAGALILYCDEKIEIAPENTATSYLHYIVKILNQRGKEDFAEAAIDYDSTYERPELLYARTIKPDGGVVEVGSRHIRDVSKYLNFPLYSNARVYIISFPEVAEGACLEYKLKIYRSQLINKKDFILSYSLQAPEPT